MCSSDLTALLSTTRPPAPVAFIVSACPPLANASIVPPAVITALAPLATKPGVTLLDITAKWLQPDGSVNLELMPDSLHPNEKGYAVWAEALRPVLPTK